jgi:hypothetical protein
MTDTAVVLTYPGHFLMTGLCLKSLDQHYPSIRRVYVLFDDLSERAWPSYFEDMRKFLQPNTSANLVYIPYSQVHDHMHRCEVGWWRQQLIKLTLDTFLPEERWFVVDGDVVFDQHIDIQNATPIHTIYGRQDELSEMVTRYVDTVMGVPNTRSWLPDAITSSIPFRWLTRENLAGLRKHAENNIGDEFVKWHIDQMLDQEIVGYVPEGDKMVMHEWELIEAWHHYHAPNHYKLLETGSGYQPEVDTSQQISQYRFRHGSYISHVDSHLTLSWFVSQGLDVPMTVWYWIHNPPELAK